MSNQIKIGDTLFMPIYIGCNPLKLNGEYAFDEVIVKSVGSKYFEVDFKDQYKKDTDKKYKGVQFVIQTLRNTKNHFPFLFRSKQAFCDFIETQNKMDYIHKFFGAHNRRADFSESEIETIFNILKAKETK